MRRVVCSLGSVLMVLLLLGGTSVTHSRDIRGSMGSVAAAVPPSPDVAAQRRAVSRSVPDGVGPCPSAPRTSRSGSDAWRIDCVVCTKEFSRIADRSLRVDGGGNLHVAYGGKHLYYARSDGKTWHYDVVDESPSVGTFASLTLDGLERPHIIYFAEPDGILKYASWDGLGWQVETIGGAGWYHSLALDVDGHPHISYYESVSSSLVYTSFDGTDWYSETVDYEGGEWSSLALDGAGHPHIAYHGGAYGDLTYAWYDGEDWQSETVALYTGSYISLALDELDRPRMSYAADGDLTYAWRDGVDWERVTVDDSLISATSLALDGAGRPHISYFRDRDQLIRYAWHNGEAWQTETVGRAGNREACRFSSLALDAADQPHVAYQGDHCDLMVANQDGNGWRTKRVDESSTVGSTSLATDALGRPHVGYERRGVRHGWQVEGAWHQSTVDGAGGGHVSLALDGVGGPHLAYGADGGVGVGGTLEHAWRDNGGWHVETVDEGGCDWCSFRYQSLAVDSWGEPAISYCLWTSRFYCAGLRFAWRDGGTWNTESVETGGGGDYGSLALDELDRPHISYFGPEHGDLKYAWRDQAGWHIEVVDRDGVTGLYSSLALDQLGRPHISYLGPDDSGLRYAWKDGGVWHIEAVDGSGDAFSSLALDSRGRPHIAYESGGYLAYAWRDGAGWRIETVDALDGQPSLDLDGLNQPHVSYSSDGHLKVARRPRPALSMAKEASPAKGLGGGEALTYTLTLSGPGLAVRMSDPLPETVQYISGSVTSTADPPAVYSPTGHEVTWAGTLPTRTLSTIRFQVAPAVTATGLSTLSPPIVNTAWLTDTTYDRTIAAGVIVNARRVYLPLLLR